MVRVSRQAIIATACLAVAVTAGCVTPSKTTTPAAPNAAGTPPAAKPKSSSILPVSFQEITGEVASLVLPTEAPAAGMICMWQPHISHLPDPAKNGHMSPGLAGQVFLLDAADKPTKANGKLTVDLYDESAVRHGGEAKLIERWVFDRETLKKLASTDEIFGRNYTLFLPWPGYKPELNQVRLMAKYEPVDSHPVYAPASSLTLVPNKPVIQMRSETLSAPPPAPFPGTGPSPMFQGPR